MTQKNLPLGIQDFEDIISGNYIYVDKTEKIYNLLSTPKGFYFISRPRSFGKSVLVSTLSYIFDGRKDLFEGLWIAENSDYNFERHPVLRIDFNRITCDTPEMLEESIANMFMDIVQDHQLNVVKEDISRLFGNIIIALRKKYHQDVVVLIDEYDRPIMSHISKGDEGIKTADRNRDILKQLFGVLKGQDIAGHLRLVFLTGKSNFSRASVFSDINNLEDLTISPLYADLLGYTETELHHYFEGHIETLGKALAITDVECKDKLRIWYGGYRFTKSDVKIYNPFSTLSVLKSLDFRNYWFDTGAPAFHINLIKKYNYPITQIEQLKLRDTSFTKYDIEARSLEALLFQTGYITIKDKGTGKYHLSYPNQEVKNSFLDYVYHNIISTPDAHVKNQFIDLADYLEDSRYDAFIDTINLILSSITYNQDESHYQENSSSFYHKERGELSLSSNLYTVFYLMLGASGIEVQTEVLASIGRLDLAVFFNNRIFIIALESDSTADSAIKRIKDKRYAKRYEHEDNEIIIMGINFDSKTNSITDCKLESVFGGLVQQDIH